MKTGIFLTDRQINLIEFLLSREVETFSNKNNLLCIEMEEIQALMFERQEERKRELKARLKK